MPILLDAPSKRERQTAELYSNLWEKFASRRHRPSGGYRAPATSHLELLRMAAGWDLIEGTVGIDAGCGPGDSVLEVADRHPDITVVGVDLADGVLSRATAAARRPNAHLVQGNLLAIPLTIGRFDFVYSFGVLHHTAAPFAAFERLLRCLRPGGRITVFVYKDFSDLWVKRALLAPVTWARRWSVRLPPSLLQWLAWGGAPLVYGLLTLPARVLARLGATTLARHIPYGTFPSLRAVASSLQDRFGAPFEHRFSAADLWGWVKATGLTEARVVDCFKFGFSGLVLAGRKATAVPAP
ncbi:MAG: class I SAM-dependent methyltransferase [Acidobacteriia bacterium]|nr:class I SAM-dependent methyltransferase [Terriglobia bacterium]